MSEALWKIDSNSRIMQWKKQACLFPSLCSDCILVFVPTGFPRDGTVNEKLKTQEEQYGETWEKQSESKKVPFKYIHQSIQPSATLYSFTQC